MPTSSSIPLAIFESLTIDPDMSPTSAEIRSRAIEVRDILSSFDRDVLPSEFKPQIFEQLDRPFQTRPPRTQWTIQEDLPGTLLQWGAYNDQAYELLASLQSSSTLARCFYEKLTRRFKRLIDEYDHLPDHHRPIRNDIQRIATDFRHVVAAVKDDRPYRTLGESAIATRLIEALIDVCRRHTDIASVSEPPLTPRRSKRHSTSSVTEGPSNLFEALITNPANNETADTFMLDLLETFPGHVFTALEQQHRTLMSLLDVNHAPNAYKYRIGRLPSGAHSAEAGASDSHRRSQSVAPGLVGSSRGERSQSPPVASETQVPSETEVEVASRTRSLATATTGSKRSAEDTSPITRRGKKKAP